MILFGIPFSSSDIYLLGAAGVLCMVVIGAFVNRQNSVAVRRREERDKTTSAIVSPFNDTILNIEHGEHNHISIMNSFFASQKESISRAKAISSKSQKRKLENAWNKYEMFYKLNARDRVLGQFISLPEDIEKEKIIELRVHVNNIMKLIKEI